MSSHLNNSWDNLLEPEFSSSYFDYIRSFLIEEYKTKKVYPPKKEILTAFEDTAYEDVKVVIIGQDPYHGFGQANGLCFSVKPGIKCPPSLVNIYKALEIDLGIKPTTCGDLRGWAKQGVLLLNTVLTVREGEPQSHSKIGWQRFTDSVIRLLNKREDPMVFILWGGPAQKKKLLIDTNKHLVLESVHPSPLSAYHGFFECRHFSKANAFLEKNNKKPINWGIRSLSEWENSKKG